MGRPAPKYWWDFSDNANSVIVQSDYDGGKCLATFAFVGYVDRAIKLAEELISDFESGRKTPKWSKQP